MATIKLVELRGSTKYILSVNNKTVTINKWKNQFDSLKQFINDCEQALLSKDTELIRSLPSKYGLNNPWIVFSLSEGPFFESFIKFFVACGEKFMEQGKWFSAKQFCNLIQPDHNKNLMNRFRALFNEAEKHFNDTVALSALQRAFNQSFNLQYITWEEYIKHYILAGSSIWL